MLDVTLCQIPYQRDADAAAATMRAAVADGPGHVCIFPELFLDGYWEGTSPGTSAAAFHRSIDSLRNACASAGRGLVFGCVYSDEPETDNADTLLFNAAVYISPDGRDVGVHRKTVLYGDRESAVFARGDTSRTWAVNGRSFALCICYELEHSDIVAGIVRDDPEMLVCISGNMKPLCSDHSEALPARARENCTRIVYVNATGPSGELDMCGASAFIDSDGSRLVSMGEGAACVTIRV